MAINQPVAVALWAIAVAAGASSQAAAPEKTRVYLGTYTRANTSEGIYLAELNMADGRLSEPMLAGKVVNPSFVSLHPTKPFLYAAGEVGDSKTGSGGAVTAFAIDEQSGKLTALNQESSQGAGPCHLTVDPSGRAVAVVNYGSGSVACLPIGSDGRLGTAASFHQHSGSSVNPKRQQGPHAHSVNIDKSGRLAFVADLGLDKIFIYRLDAARALLTPHEPAWVSLKPGSGPRHFAFHPGGRFAYVINELASTITAFNYDAARGTLTAMQTISTLPPGFNGDNTTAEVQVHPSGRFVYGSNRGHDSIAIFAVNPDSGRLKHLGNEPSGGKTPRNFGIDPTGHYLLAANQASDNVVSFRINGKTGLLRPVGSSIQVGSPVCVKFVRP